jgi:hypothetical protein
MIGLLKSELGLAAGLSVPAAVVEATQMLECAFPDGASLRRKVQLLCDECGLLDQRAAPPAPAAAAAAAVASALAPAAQQTDYAGVAATTAAAQPTVEALLNDAVSRLEALVDYPGSGGGGGGQQQQQQQLVPTAVSPAKIEKHIERVKQYPPLAKPPQVDMAVDATNHHPPSDKTQEERIALAVAEGVQRTLADGLFDAGWQRQEYLGAVRSEMDAVRKDAESNVAKEMMKMRMEARDKAQEERERNMRRSFDAVAAQREKALAEREAELAAMSREAAFARREAMLAAAEQRSTAGASAATMPMPPMRATTSATELPPVAMASSRPSTQPTTPPSEPAEPQAAAPSAAAAGPRKRRDALFEHLNLLKGLKMRGLLDEGEYERRKASILDKYERAQTTAAGDGSQTVR